MYKCMVKFVFEEITIVNFLLNEKLRPVAV